MSRTAAYAAFVPSSSPAGDALRSAAVKHVQQITTARARQPAARASLWIVAQLTANAVGSHSGSCLTVRGCQSALHTGTWHIHNGRGQPIHTPGYGQRSHDTGVAVPSRHAARRARATRVPQCTFAAWASDTPDTRYQMRWHGRDLAFTGPACDSRSRVDASARRTPETELSPCRGSPFISEDKSPNKSTN